jgi:stage II sporulation protein AA (anti-sigma F factor antagonist)
MKYKIENEEMVVFLDSELDHHNANITKEKIDSEVMKGRVKTIGFDFTNTNFMDSSGIGIIMGRYKLLEAIGGNVYVTNINKNIERIFLISGLYKIIERK